MSLMVFQGSLELGIIYAIMVLGVFISFRTLNMPDLTVDGSFVLGAAVSAVMCTYNAPYIGLILAFVAGCGAGCITALLHTKLKIQPLLAGILTMLALYSINLKVMFNKPNIPLLNKVTIFSNFENTFLGGASNIVISVVILIIVLAILFFFLKTRIGFALRATGDNEHMVRSLGINTDTMILMGLAISNGLVALSGAIIAQYQSFADISMGTGPKCVLMGMIDDATGNIYGQFHAYEGTLPAMACFKGYVQKYGIPLAVYLDRHTTYKSTTKVTMEDEMAGVCPLSEFGRAMAEFEVEMIYAHTPQAKGRVERLFRTLQDRLVKEMRLLGISSIQAANKFLKTYLSKFNKQFSVKPANEADLHRAVPERLDLDKILCIRTPRALRNDFTVAHDKKLYQVETAVQTDRVLVEDKIDGSMVISYQGKQLKIREILERPEKATPRKRKYRGPKSGAKRLIIPIERLLWNDGAQAESSPASWQSHAA